MNPQPRYHSIIIGVDHLDHPGPFALLEGCVNDALAFHDQLRKLVPIAEEHSQLLLAPRAGRSGPPLPARFQDARVDTIRAAFRRTAEQVQPGDHVIVFYAAHGAALRHGESTRYALVPQDLRVDFDDPAALRTALTTAELNALLRRLTRQATASVFADTCHSAFSTRGRARGRSVALTALTPEQWRRLAALLETQGVEAQDDGEPGADLAGDRWAFFAACQRHETSFETSVTLASGSQVQHGLFSRTLVDALSQYPAEAARRLRWRDLVPAVRHQVERAARKLHSAPAQSPRLDGDWDGVVLSGAVAPAEPGYEVTPGEEGLLAIGAGSLENLTKDARVVLFPAGEPPRPGSAVEALITQADFTSSTAFVQAPGLVPGTRYRAQLLAQSSTSPKLRVALPPAFASAVAKTPGAAQRLTLVEPAGEARFAVVAYEGGYAITEAGAALTPDQIIAVVPPPEVPQAGLALGSGLLHLAEYERRLGQTSSGGALSRCFSGIELLIGDKAAANQAVRTQRLEPGHGLRSVSPRTSAGALYDGERMTMRLRIAECAVPGWYLDAAVLIYSSDGNILRWWPYCAGDKETLGVSADGRAGNAFFLRRPDRPLEEAFTLDLRGESRLAPRPTLPAQTRSRYVVQLVAALLPDGARPIDVKQLALEQTVQEVIDQSWNSTRGGVARADDELQPCLLVCNIPVDRLLGAPPTKTWA